MSNKIYVGDIGLAILANCGVETTEAENIVMEVTKPDGTIATWNTEITSVGGIPNYLVHYTEAGDLDQAGTYRVQPKFRLSTWNGLGETAKFKVYEAFK